MATQMLSEEQVQQLEALLRSMRRRTAKTIAGILILAMTLGIAIFAVLSSRYDADATVHNASSIASLNRELSIERQQSDEQARLYGQFLQDFTAEQDYVCRIAAAFAVENGLEPPKAGLCTVTLPTPRPTPSPAPSTAPPRTTAPPARAAPTRAATPAPTASETSVPTPTPLIRLPLPTLPILGLPHAAGRSCGLLEKVLELTRGHRNCKP